MQTLQEDGERRQEIPWILSFSYSQISCSTQPVDSGAGKGNVQGNSLAVQQLGLCSFIAEGPGSIPAQGNKIPEASWWGQKRKDICSFFKKETCKHHRYLFQNIFITPKRNPMLISSHSPPWCPLAPGNYESAFSMDFLFWTLHINGIIQDKWSLVFI